ncbi:MAG: hypothetical protein ACE5I2_15645 [Anaerolineae bacterium]
MTHRMKLIQDYGVDVEYPNVSGFEILEMLNLRSRIARLEPELTGAERAALEEADRRLIQNVYLFHTTVSEVADLAKVRQRVNVFPSHWWWYLDVLVQLTKVAA